MILIDVNVLVYAKRLDSPNHAKFRAWLEDIFQSDSIVGVSDLVLNGVVRILTHRHVFGVPTDLDEALEYVNRIRDHSGCVSVSPGERHWGIFTRLCRESGAKGNLVSDAYLAAMAIESGSEWITADRHFARFRGLRWRHPLA
jgi:toxin-antitoxin system PIN domain toxin